MTQTTTDRHNPLGWARPWATARPFARPMPRAGAWYPVLAEAGNERLVLEIRGKKVAVQKQLLELRPARPNTFTVVVRTRDTLAGVEARRGPLDRTYAVCPECTNRVKILPQQSAASCPECKHRGEVAWWETG